MKFLSVVTFLAAFLNLNTFAQARGTAVEKRGTSEPTLDSRVKEMRGKGTTSAPVTQVQTANGEAVFKADASQQLEACSGDCSLPKALASVAHKNGQNGQTLSSQAIANASQATQRAAVIMKSEGVTPQVAQTKALKELGLDPNAVKENCK